ncbi:MAG TPA: DUF2000 domain-containing protein [Ktedonobacterales bacterium]
MDSVEITDTADSAAEGATLTRVRFDTKIALVLRADLPVWQQLNMATFLVSGIAATVEGAVGEPYEDASGVRYLPMFRQPVMVFAATAEQLRTAYERARARELPIAIFTDDLFATGHDEANRAAVRAVTSDELRLAGLALRAGRKAVDTVVKGLSLHE